jgi:hypothetical protein
MTSERAEGQKPNEDEVRKTNAGDRLLSKLFKTQPLPISKDAQEERDKVIETLLNDFSERERGIVYDRFGFDERSILSLRGIGKNLKITGSRVAQIERRALRKLRHPVRGRNLYSFIPFQPATIGHDVGLGCRYDLEKHIEAYETRSGTKITRGHLSISQRSAVEIGIAKIPDDKELMPRDLWRIAEMSRDFSLIQDDSWEEITGELRRLLRPDFQEDKR